MNRPLWNAQNDLAEKVRTGAVDTATELGDADTADLFTEISRSVDKLLWKVEAYGQAKD